MVRMQWLYYVLAGLAVVVLLNVVLVVYLAVASRESEEHRPADL